MPSSTDAMAGALFLHPYATISVTSHVPIKLELHSSNYGKWSAFFKAMCGKFGLLHHINGSVSQDVHDFAMAEDQTARELWVAISNKFQANQAPCAIFLSKDFHSMTQGDLSVMEFGKKMKLAADALREVGHPVAEPTLLPNLLRGIHPKFSNTKDIVAGTKNITFDEALNQFALKELRLANKAKVLSSSTLVTSSTGCGSSCRSSSTAGQQQRWCKKKGWKGGSNSGGAQQQQQQTRGHTPNGSWFYFSPWGAPSGMGSSTGGMGWRGQGLLGSARSKPTLRSPRASLHDVPAAIPAAVPAAARTIMGPSGSDCGFAADAAAGIFSMGDGLRRLHPHALLGWYTSLSLTCFACFYFGRQWFTYSRNV